MSVVSENGFGWFCRSAIEIGSRGGGSTAPGRANAGVLDCSTTPRYFFAVNSSEAEFMQ
jgi:hypothetical protein